MPKPAIWTVILTLALTTIAFAATDEEQCQKKKLVALGQRALCHDKERAKEVVGKTPNTAKCDEKFDKRIAAAEKKVACRWLDNDDGTATDLDSGLQWELKTDDGSIHDKDDVYAWSASVSEPDGGAFVDFLGTLNGGESPNGVATTGCFADRCDWRLPTIEELAGLVDLGSPGCGEGSPCTTIPGETVPSFYWSSSSSTFVPSVGFLVNFSDGNVYNASKIGDESVRAVRGGP